MSLVRKVGSPETINRTPMSEGARDVLKQAREEINKTLNENKLLKNKLDEERHKPPKVVVEEKIVEVEVDSPALVKKISDLQLQHKAVQKTLKALDQDTTTALQSSNLQILALESRLDQVLEQYDHKRSQIRAIKALTDTRRWWPFVRKKTLKEIL